MTQPTKQPKRVLVVDDEPEVRELFCSYLQDAGFEAVAACGAREAYDMFSREHFDLVTLDFRMTGVDGAGLHRYLSRSFGYGQPMPNMMPPKLPPILLITGWANDPAVLALAGNESMAGVLEKPVGRQELLERVGAILARADRRRSARRKVVARLDRYLVRGKGGQSSA